MISNFRAQRDKSMTSFNAKIQTFIEGLTNEIVLEL